MKNFIAQNKKLLFAIGCGLLAVIILVVVFTACVDDDKNVTNPTGVASEATGGIVTTPSNVTEPTVTEPSDVTEPTVPDVTEPQEPQEPTEPEKPSTPTQPEKPVDKFGGITVGNITYEQWKSWDQATRQAFRNATSLKDATPDERYNYYCATEFQGGYDCGYENHYCVSKSGHNKLVDAMAEGCPYCGSNDCVSFYARDNRGITKINYEKCPKYNNNCEVCGLPESRHDVQSGETYCCKLLKDMNCPDCGEFVKAGECHHHVKP